MESPTEKGLENWSPTPHSMFPITSFAANAVATPALILLAPICVTYYSTYCIGRQVLSDRLGTS